MLARYLVSIGAISLQESKKKNFNAVSSPHPDKGRTFHIHLLVESFCIIVQKNLQGFRHSFVLNLFLIFHQISVSCSYKIVPIKKSVFRKTLPCVRET